MREKCDRCDSVSAYNEELEAKLAEKDKEKDEWFAKWNRAMNSLSAAEKEIELNKITIKALQDNCDIAVKARDAAFADNEKSFQVHSEQFDRIMALVSERDEALAAVKALAESTESLVSEFAIKELHPKIIGRYRDAIAAHADIIKKARGE